MSEKNILQMTIPDLKAARLTIEKKIGDLNEAESSNPMIIQKLQNMANQYTKAERQINKYFEKNKKKPGFTNGGRNAIKLIDALKWYNKPIMGADINPVKKGYNFLDGMNDLQGFLTGAGVSIMGFAVADKISKTITKQGLMKNIGNLFSNNPAFMTMLSSGALLLLIAKGVPAIRRKASQMKSNIAEVRKTQNEVVDEIYGDTFDRKNLLQDPKTFKAESAEKLGEQLANSPEMLIEFMEIVKERDKHPEFSNSEISNIVEALKMANKTLTTRKADRDKFLSDGPIGIDDELYKHKTGREAVSAKPTEIETAIANAKTALGDAEKIKVEIETKLANANAKLEEKTNIVRSLESEVSSASDNNTKAEKQTSLLKAKRELRLAQANVDKISTAHKQATEAVDKIKGYVTVAESQLEAFKTASTKTEISNTKKTATQAGLDANTEKDNAVTAEKNAETLATKTSMTPTQKKALLTFIDTYLGSATDATKKGTIGKANTENFTASNILTSLNEELALGKNKGINIELGSDNTITGLSRDQAEDIAGLLEVFDTLSNDSNLEKTGNDYTESRAEAIKKLKTLKQDLGLNSTIKGNPLSSELKSDLGLS